MANPEHVEIVKRGPDSIRRWNEMVPRDPLDLSGVDFQGIDLTGTNLSVANLSDSNLTRANLNSATLVSTKFSNAILNRVQFVGSNLTGAKMQSAKLIRANLCGANLHNANLSAADLSGSMLYSTNFHGTDLEGANLNDCKCGATEFADLDLRRTLGLERLQHAGPSEIGIETIYRSEGQIPEAFLRRCGIREAFISMMPSLVRSVEPIQFYSCFISFSHEDDDFAKRLYSSLQQEKVRVWYAPEDLKYGRKIHEEIESAIRVHDKLLLVLSDSSMASRWVKTEIDQALKREREEGRRVLFPISLVPLERVNKWKAFNADLGTDMAREIREYLIPDFSNWKVHDAFEAGLKRLLEGLKAAESVPN